MSTDLPTPPRDPTDSPAAADGSGSPGLDSFALWDSGQRTQVNIGDTIGRYRIMDMLGEGGMGRVYLAEQTGSLRRHVAIKFLRSGLDTAQVLARFRFEQQTLARLTHHAIAQVLDAGETVDGTPYFVMEYVPGLPVTQHADKHRLTLDQRLELFIELCAAVRHAHSRGILHRDLKPNNILVRKDDDSAIPKVIDWGIAHAMALDSPRDEGRIGQPIGTPEYMSPEQARRKPVDHRTDIFALGVILYELLTGQLPIASATLRSAGGDLASVIERASPDPPSTCVRNHPDAAAIAANRGTTPDQLIASLEAGPDELVHHAMAASPDDRYGDLDAFMAAVRACRGESSADRSPEGSGRAARAFAIVTIMAMILVTGIYLGSRGRDSPVPPEQTDGERDDNSTPVESPRGATWAERYERARDPYTLVRRTEIDAFPSVATMSPRGDRIVTIENGVGRLYSVDFAPILPLGWMINGPDSVSFSNDGALLALVTTNAAANCQIRSAADGQIVTTLDGTNSAAVAVHFLDNTEVLVVRDRSIEWRIASDGDTTHRITTDEDILCTAHRRNSRRIAVALTDRTILVIDPDTADRHTLRTPNEQVATALAWSPDMRRIAIGSSAGTWIVDAASGETLARFTDHTLACTSLQFNASGTMLAGADPERIILWNLESGSAAHSYRADNITLNQRVFSNEQSLFLAQGLMGTPQLIDMPDASVLSELRGVDEPLVALSFTDNDSEIIAVGPRADGGVLLRWSRESDREVIIEPTDRWPLDAVFLPGSNELLVASGSPTTRFLDSPRVTMNSLDVFDASTGEHRRQVAALDATPEELAIDPQGTLGILITDDGVLRSMDLTTGEELDRLYSPNPDARLQHLCLADAGRLIVASDSERGVYSWARGGNGTPLRYADESMTFVVRAIAATDDGRYVAAAAQDGGIRIWDAKSGELLHRLDEVVNSFAFDLDFSDDGSRLAVSGGQRAAILDLATQSRLLLTEPMMTDALAVVFMQDESSLLVGTASHLALLQAADGTTRLRLPTPETDHPPVRDFMRSVRISPDGTTIVAVHDGRIYLFRAPAG